MATLTIDLDDQASVGIDALNSHFDELTKVTDKAADAAQDFSKVQQQQITLTQKQTVGFSTLANTGFQVFGQVGTAGIKAFAQITIAVEHARAEMAQLLVKEGASLIKWTIGAGATLAGLNIVFGKHRKATKDSADAADEAAEKHSKLATALKAVGAGLGVTTVAVADQTLGYQVLTKASGSALRSVSGLGPEIVALTIAAKAYAAVLSVTGKNTWELSDGTEKFGNNLEALQAQVGVFGKDVKRDLGEAYEALQNLGTASRDAFDEFAKGVKKAIADSPYWQEFDKVVTRDNAVLIQNIQNVNKAYNDGVSSAQAWFNGITGGPGGEKYKQQAQFDQDQKKHYRELQGELDKAADGFKRIGAMNDLLAEKEEKRAASERRGSIASIAQIDAEIEATKKRMNASAQSGELSNRRIEKPEEFTGKGKNKKRDEDYGQHLQDYEDSLKAEAESLKKVAAFETELTELQARRRALEKQAADQQRARHKDYMSDLQAQAEIEKQIAADRFREMGELMVMELKRGNAFANLQKDLQSTQKRFGLDNQDSAAKDQHEAQKDRVSQMLELQGVEGTKIKEQLAAMDRRFAEESHKRNVEQIQDEARQKLRAIQAERDEAIRRGIDSIVNQKELVRLQGEEEKARADRIKKQLEENARFARDMNQRDLADKQRVEAEKFNAEKARLDKVKALNDQAMQKAFDPKAMMEAGDPRKVFKALQDERARKAGQAQMEKDQGLFDKAQAGFALGVPDEASANAAKKWLANQQRVQARAKRQAMNDFENGNIDQGEVAQAQGKVAEQTLNTFQKQGKLQGDQVKAMTDSIKTLADQQQAIDNMQQTMDQIIAFQKGQKQVARSTVKSTQNQQGSLN